MSVPVIFWQYCVVNGSGIFILTCHSLYYISILWWWNFKQLL